jgi:hypothetical protein
VVDYLWALCACGLGVGSLIAARRTLHLRRRVLGWPTVPGKITSRETIQPTDRGRTSAPGFRWAPDVRYTYTVGGTEREGDKTTLPWSATGSQAKAQRALDRIPDDVAVRYDPGDPATSCLEPPGRRNVVIFVLAGIGAILLGLLYVV